MRPDIALLYWFLRLAGLLPLRVLHGMGAGLGSLLARGHGPTARHTAVNLRLVRPRLDDAERTRLQRAALAHAGRSLTEMACIWGRRPRAALALVREVRGGDRLEDALASDRGLIIAAPHIGCWELLNYWLCAQTSMAILYRPPRLSAFEPLLRRARGALAAEQVRAKGAGMRSVYKRLAGGGTVGILPDQKPRQGDGIMAPFFGHDALTMTLLPRLAARTDATVLFAFAERMAHGKGFRIHILPAPEGIAAMDPALACVALNRGIEACVERAFTQYQWHYKRYSVAGRPSPYA